MVIKTYLFKLIYSLDMSWELNLSLMIPQKIISRHYGQKRRSIVFDSPLENPGNCHLSFPQTWGRIWHTQNTQTVFLVLFCHKQKCGVKCLMFMFMLKHLLLLSVWLPPILLLDIMLEYFSNMRNRRRGSQCQQKQKSSDTI